MGYFSWIPLAVGGLFLATSTTAQRRSVGDLVVVPEAQVEVALRGADYLLAGFNLITNPDGGSTFAGGQLRLGYEHFWNERRGHPTRFRWQQL
jgi:hypothetical protein